MNDGINHYIRVLSSSELEFNTSYTSVHFTLIKLFPSTRLHTTEMRECDADSCCAGQVTDCYGRRGEVRFYMCEDVTSRTLMELSVAGPDMYSIRE